jgi:putative phosphoserine phosphatase/1-acylglycerol-3-phosphate O-acyltransferase
MMHAYDVFGESLPSMMLARLAARAAKGSARAEVRQAAQRAPDELGAPVIPLGVWGAEQVRPRSSRVPNLINVLHPPTIRVRVGPPVEGLTGSDFAADTDRIMAAIAAQLPPKARLRRIPSAQELAPTLAPGQRAVP